MKINNKGYWENDTNIGHCNDDVLLQKLIEFIKKNKINNVVDFGCGDGFYISNIVEHINYYEAYDGNPFTEKLTNGLGKIIDLSEKFNLDKKFDLVISLEVGEHIPKKFENVFLDNITNHSSRFLIISWAIENQIGDGHVNCQNNDYIINEIKKRDFVFLNDETKDLRDPNLKLPWFKDTLMVFKKLNFENS